MGFKSFVDPTELVIAPGLSGVVGPNGCGKSNLLEALRWVMGENRPSVMRGDGMEDVIFNGSRARPARNHAEVTLTLDNRDRRAPSGFNEDDELQIVRRITREAGSAYRANGREARARDIQMLFADASTGAQSPALVRQGQISELINARPKARRRILEEAAGISGLYQRRHEAELKLRATETNLGRVADVLEALDTQLASLGRQARQAQRYREIAESLRRAEALLAWRHWHDAEVARAETAAGLTAATRAAGSAQAEAAAAARLRAEAEEVLPAVREEDAIAGAVLQRLTLERDRLEAEVQAAVREIAGLESQIAQLASDRDREAALDQDAVSMTVRLAEEDAGLVAEGEGHEAAVAAARVAAAEAAEGLKAFEAEFDARAEAAARLVAEHQAAGRLLDDARRRAGELGQALAAAEAARGAAARELAAAEAARTEATAAEEVAAAAAEAAEAELEAAEHAAAAARSAEAAARGRRSEAEGAAKALTAEASGLERLLARPAGAEDPVLDAVAVAPGYEVALGAALAEDLTLPLPSWQVLPPYDAPATLPAGAAPLAAQVAAPAALARRLAAIGVVAREDGARLQAALAPGQRLVSREGDLWRWDGLAVAAGGAPTAAALRLQQRNRLAELREAIAAAEVELDAARAAEAAAAGTAGEAASAEARARAARRATEQAAAEAARAKARAETALEALEGRVGTLTAATARRSDELGRARAAAEAAEAAAAALADPAAAQGGGRGGADAGRGGADHHADAAGGGGRAGAGRQRPGPAAGRDRAGNGRLGGAAGVCHGTAGGIGPAGG